MLTYPLPHTLAKTETVKEFDTLPSIDGFPFSRALAARNWPHIKDQKSGHNDLFIKRIGANHALSREKKTI